MHVLSTPIEYLKGVGPIRAELLKKELRIFTYEDLLMHYPFRYIDKSNIHLIRNVSEDISHIQFKGKIVRLEEKGLKRSKRLIAYFRDSSGEIELVWFKSIKWIKTSINLDKEYLVFGKPSSFGGKINLVHPDLDPVEGSIKDFRGLHGVYSTTEKLINRGLNSRAISKLVKNLIPFLSNAIEESLSNEILEKYKLPKKKEALINIHLSRDLKELERAQKRLKFEELFFLQLHLIKIKIIRNNKFIGYSLSSLGENFNTYYSKYLKFELTNAQKRVLKEIRLDVKNNKQMNRLLQGDVGSGKTIVALLSMLMAVDNGFQACIMAPTEILAQQHFTTISEELKGMDINVDILTGSKKTKARRELVENLENGNINLLVGTHALLEDYVKFKNLGFVVIDEQHRFGVAQRAKLWKKNKFPPHILVMTATPIPRTLSMTLYGDLDISIIDELPPGRKLVQTLWRSDSSRLNITRFMKEQIALGRQIYIVFPLIDESAKLDYKNLIEGYDSISIDFPLPDFQVSVVHGKMKSDAKEYEMNRFINGTTDIMVATTVIEVGVNVPNASVMIIESAERFGLSQLHQLRGRVGRGASQSYCVLMSGDKVSNEGKTRLKTMVDTTDGFKIAEVDLKLRGPGDMMGTKQSGILDFKIADIVKDGKILEYARKEAFNLLEDDVDLLKSENINIARFYRPYARERMGWSRIS
ncbi:MAG: ATP-dependent DNA helicase RecG [Flavobacteriales bacterium]|jgi:ATP-dependent DNA helicase RecG|tara:strand:- start:91 stop:2187 length:2097 start_codon:yes stop_codon:yes gene_type:complete